MSNTFFCRMVRFTAAHHYALPGLDLEQNSERFGLSAFPHFHDWQLTVWLTGPLDQAGMIADLMEVDRVLDEVVVRPFHQAHINQVDPLFETTQPTTEVLAGYFAEKIQARLPVTLSRLRIAESETLFAEWHS